MSSTTHAAVDTNLQAKVVTVSQQWGPRIRIGNDFPVKQLCPTGVNHMQRGFRSLRITNVSSLHHLSVNTGGRADVNFWVAYTLPRGSRNLLWEGDES